MQYKTFKRMGALLAYITKNDTGPWVWGEFTKEQIIEILDKSRKKKKITMRVESILQELEKCKTWFYVYDNPTLRDRLFQYELRFLSQQKY